MVVKSRSKRFSVNNYTENCPAKSSFFFEKNLPISCISSAILPPLPQLNFQGKTSHLFPIKFATADATQYPAHAKYAVMTAKIGVESCHLIMYNTNLFT